MRPLVRLLVSLLVVTVLVAGTVMLIRNSNGDYSGDYALSGLFAKAGEGLQPGSEVVFRGVQIGRVSTVALQNDMAKVTLLITPTFHVPADATATIEPVNLFGAEQVSLTSPDHNADHGAVPGAQRGSSSGPKTPTAWAISSPPPRPSCRRSIPLTSRPCSACWPRPAGAKGPR